MPNISDEFIKDSYNYVLQADFASRYVYRIGGGVPFNPIFSSGLTILNSFTFSNGSENEGYVLTSDSLGNASWMPVSGTSGISGLEGISGLSGMLGLSGISGISGLEGISGLSGISGDSGISGLSGLDNSGNFLNLSGGTVTGLTTFNSGLTVVSAFTYQDGQEFDKYILTSDSNGLSSWKANYGFFGVTIDNGENTITSGIKGYFSIPYNGVIDSYKIISPISGTCEVDLLKNTIIPNTGDSITNGNYISLSSQTINTDFVLTSWSKSFTFNDVFAWNVLNSDLRYINIIIKVIKQ
jgi:hypothetical protein